MVRLKEQRDGGFAEMYGVKVRKRQKYWTDGKVEGLGRLGGDEKGL